MDFDDAVRSAVGDPDPEYPPIPEIEQFEEDRRHNDDAERCHGETLHRGKPFHRRVSLRGKYALSLSIFIRTPSAKNEILNLGGIARTRVRRFRVDQTSLPPDTARSV